MRAKVGERLIEVRCFKGRDGGFGIGVRPGKHRGDDEDGAVARPDGVFDLFVVPISAFHQAENAGVERAGAFQVPHGINEKRQAGKTRGHVPSLRADFRLSRSGAA
jgi:hypothetical protein